ncbi:uncharacterized protein TrAFT101_005922 [Trichoderma asperellum]|uniref:uncharacterized protein n=1 Tax=Trichoderma asperellum TaxID=101201 RepID=UPI003331C18E|nr:hypothetical protein TrAFT101_005922 [Trichoderma asperellum]
MLPDWETGRSALGGAKSAERGPSNYVPSASLDWGQAPRATAAAAKHEKIFKAETRNF